MGDTQIATLAYVDDILDLNGNPRDTEVAHQNAQIFASKKKLEHTPEKCNISFKN